MDAFFDDEPGYRIRPDEFALPDISLTADEAAVVGLATKVWQHARLAEATTEAVRKLTALGVDVDLTALDIVEPRLTADEPSFDVFWEATQERTPVVFDYVRSGDTEVRTRHLQPWGVARYSGRWYVVGFDTDREAERIFRLSRVQGRATKDGTAGLLRDPAGHRRERGRPAAGSRAVDRARRAAGPQGRRPHAAPRCGPGRGGRRRPGRATRPGTGWCSSAAPWDWPTRCWATAPTCTSRSRPSSVTASYAGSGRPSAVPRRPREHPGQRQGPGRAAADPGAVPARARRGPARRGGPGARRRTRTSCSATSRCCSCAGCRAATPTT